MVNDVLQHVQLVLLGTQLCHRLLLQLTCRLFLLSAHDDDKLQSNQQQHVFTSEHRRLQAVGSSKTRKPSYR